jgi:hypothetical protein
MGLVQELTDRFVVVAHLTTAWTASRLADCPSLTYGTCPDVVTERVPPALEKGVEALRLGYEECLDRARDCRTPVGVIVLFLLGVLCGVLITACLCGGLFLVSPLRRRAAAPLAAPAEGSREETIVRFAGPVSPSVLR